MEILIFLALIPLALAGIQIIVGLFGICVIAVICFYDWIKSKLFGGK